MSRKCASIANHIYKGSFLSLESCAKKISRCVLEISKYKNSRSPKIARALTKSPPQIPNDTSFYGWQTPKDGTHSFFQLNILHAGFWHHRRNLRSEMLQLTRKLTNLFDLNSEIVCLGHDRETTPSRLEPGSPPLLMRRRSNQSRQRSLHPLTFDATDSNERVRHRRSTHVQTIRKVRRRIVISTIAEILVKAASERSWMIGWRTHTGFFGKRDRTALLGDGDGTIGRDRTVIDWESYGRWSRSGVVKVDASWRCRTVVVIVVIFLSVEEGGTGGAEARACRGSKSWRRRGQWGIRWWRVESATGRERA